MPRKLTLSLQHGQAFPWSREPWSRDGTPRALNRPALRADAEPMAHTHRQERRLALVYPRAARLRAALGALAMWLVAVAWGALMLHVGVDRPATPPSGRPLALALIVLCAPFLAWGFGYWRRVVAAAPLLIVSGSRLTLIHPLLLRSPLVLSAAELSAVAVDRTGAGSARDQLRFPVFGDALGSAGGGSPTRWLYSRFAGAPMPRLATGAELPNVALLFKHHLLIDAARHTRRRPLRVNAPAGTLFRAEPASGLLLSLCDPDRLSEALSGFGLLRVVTEGDLLERGRAARYPSLVPASGSDQPRVRAEAVGGIRRRRGALVATLLWLWFAVIVVRALHDPQGPPILAGMLGLSLFLGYARRRGPRLVPPLLAHVPFPVRALLLYPLLTAALLAVGLALGRPTGQSGAAYIVFATFACALMVLLDASSQHASSSTRVAWAIATALPTLGLSGAAFSLVH